MPPKKKAKTEPAAESAPEKKFIKWPQSKARAVLIEDLVAGRMPMDDAYMNAESAWEVHYKNLDEFKRVPFKQFKERLKDHRKQLQGDLGRAKKEAEAVATHRLHFPRNNTKQDGTPLFDLHPAKELLRQDIEEKKHIGKTPTAFQLTRDEYKVFDKDIFRHRIYQEIRRIKFVNFLNENRKEGKLMRCEPPPPELYDHATDDD